MKQGCPDGNGSSLSSSLPAPSCHVLSLCKHSPGAPGQEQAMPPLSSPMPGDDMSRTQPSAMDPSFQQQRVNLQASQSSSYSLQNFIAQQQHQQQQQQAQQQQQMYLQQTVPQYAMPRPSPAGMSLRGHPMPPSAPLGSPYPPAAMSFGYASLRPAAASSVQDFKINPGSGLPYGTFPAARQPYAPFPGGLSGHEPAWGPGEAMPQLQRTMSQDHHQQQQQVWQQACTICNFGEKSAGCLIAQHIICRL